MASGSASTGLHLQKVLNRFNDALLICNRLLKRGKESQQLSMCNNAAASDAPWPEYVLTAAPVLKVSTFPAPAQHPDAKDKDCSSNQDRDNKGIDSGSKADVKGTTILRRPSELIWRMAHSQVCMIEKIPDGTLGKTPRGTDGSGGDKLYGFVVFYFCTEKYPKVKQGPVKASMEEFGILESVRQELQPPQCRIELRAREYSMTSSGVRDDWVVLYQSAVSNYWHERLENAVIAAPEVYQWHGWAMDNAPQQSGKRLLQVAISMSPESNGYLYVITRHEKGLLNSDQGIAVNAHNGFVQRVSVKNLVNCEVNKAKSSILVKFRGTDWRGELQFFSWQQCCAFVEELQRMYLMVAAWGHKGGSAGSDAADNDIAFPYSISSPQ